MIKLIAAFRNPLQFIKILYGDLVALHRGQHRLVPRIGINGKLNRIGRIYGASSGNFKAIGKVSVKLEMRVRRADGKMEHYVSDDKGFRQVK